MKFAAAILVSALMADGAQADTPLTLASYNIHVGVPMGEEIGSYKSTVSDLDNLAKAIGETGASIVALQEVDCEYGLALPARRRSSLLNQARYLAAAGQFDYVFGSAQDDTGYPTDNPEYVEWGSSDRWTNNAGEHGEVGNAILSKFPIIGKPENIPLPKDAGQERRVCIRAVLNLGDLITTKPVVVYATHLQHNSGATRYKQMKTIVDCIKAEAPGCLVFLLGDMNHEVNGSGDPKDPDKSSAENPIRLAMDSGLHDLTAPPDGKAAEAHFTFPADMPEIRIDFIFCNQPLKVVSKNIIRSLASDHLPVAVTIELP